VSRKSARGIEPRETSEASLAIGFNSLPARFCEVQFPPGPRSPNINSTTVYTPGHEPINTMSVS